MSKYHVCTQKCENAVIKSNGQWHLEKRCWQGYKPVPGKKPYEKDSCAPVKKDESSEDNRIAPGDSNNRKTYLAAFGKSDIELSEYDDGTMDVIFGKNVSEEHEEQIVKNILKNQYEEIIEKKDWSPKKEHKSEKGGLTEAGRKSYNKATGGNLKPPQPEGGPRKRSFCARNKGQINMHNIDCKKTPEKRACKARRRWKCSN
jgi:hypothetical protein